MLERRGRYCLIATTSDPTQHAVDALEHMNMVKVDWEQTHWHAQERMVHWPDCDH